MHTEQRTDCRIGRRRRVVRGVALRQTSAKHSSPLPLQQHSNIFWNPRRRTHSNDALYDSIRLLLHMYVLCRLGRCVKVRKKFPQKIDSANSKRLYNILVTFYPPALVLFAGLWLISSLTIRPFSPSSLYCRSLASRKSLKF